MKSRWICLSQATDGRPLHSQGATVGQGIPWHGKMLGKNGGILKGCMGYIYIYIYVCQLLFLGIYCRYVIGFHRGPIGILSGLHCMFFFAQWNMMGKMLG